MAPQEIDAIMEKDQGRHRLQHFQASFMYIWQLGEK